MKLYYAPGACSLAPHIVARELGIDLELVKVDTKTKAVASEGDFWAVNPKGYVPALELDDGAILTEVSALLQYLADRKPESGLVPKAGSMERYRLLELLGYIATEIHKGYGPLWYPATPEDVKASTRAALRRRYAYIEGLLVGRPYLLGDEFSVADAYLYTVTNWSRTAKVDLTEFADLLAFQKRVAARPAVQAALKAEGLLK
jgi:glutathione S-transferase